MFFSSTKISCAAKINTQKIKGIKIYKKFKAVEIRRQEKNGKNNERKN